MTSDWRSSDPQSPSQSNKSLFPQHRQFSELFDGRGGQYLSDALRVFKPLLRYSCWRIGKLESLRKLPRFDERRTVV